MYSARTSQDVGTLHQLRNLIHRTNVPPKKPSKDANASEDFLHIVMVGHIIAAAMSHFGLSMEDTALPPCTIPQDVESHEKVHYLHDTVYSFIKANTNLAVLPTHHRQPPKSSVDGVHEYAREVCTLALLYEEFRDAISEADGTRVLRCWKFLLLLFRASHRTNYACEALTLLTQYNMTLPPRMAMQLKWSRFINSSGKPGCNIPCDLHLEHINRTVKTAVSTLGPNVTPKAIQRVGVCVGPLMEACRNFDKETHTPVHSGKHAMKSFSKDLAVIVKELHSSKVFSYLPGRKHNSVSIKYSLINTLKYDDTVSWIKERTTKLLESTS